jgi:UrcA family protein
MKNLIPIALLAGAFFASPSVAAPAPAGAPHVVRYADLDLSSPAGRQALDRRIGLAVRDACGAASDVDIHGKNVVVRCRVEARAEADLQRAVALATLSAGGDQIASAH